MFSRLAEALAEWLAWRLPRRVVYWAAVRLMTASSISRDMGPSDEVCKMLDEWSGQKGVRESWLKLRSRSIRTQSRAR